VIPLTIVCEDCGSTAKVRGYGRVEYDWGEDQSRPTQVEIKSIRLTVDCPTCGVKPQDFHPNGQPSNSGITHR
jgi:hypothetical protein